MDYLVHHGILGMKWGIRRYQNKDGTLTLAGKQRYRGDEVPKSRNAKVRRNIGTAAKAIGVAGAAAGAYYAVRSPKVRAKIAGQVAAYELDKAVDNYGKPERAKPDVNYKEMSKGANASRTALEAIKKSRTQKKDAIKINEAKKEIEGMSDAELQKIVQRMNLEQQYVNMRKSSISTGKDRVDAFLSTSISVLSMAGALLTVAGAVKSLSGKG